MADDPAFVPYARVVADEVYGGWTVLAYYRPRRLRGTKHHGTEAQALACGLALARRLAGEDPSRGDDDPDRWRPLTAGN